MAQLVRRESEERACPIIMKKNAIHRKRDVIVNPDIPDEYAVDLESIILHGVEINTSKPNSIVQLDSNEILRITKIKREGNIFVHGFGFKTVTDIFTFPCESTKVGIMKLGRLSRKEKIVSLENIRKKCVLFENDNNTFAVTFLHNT